MQYPSEYPSEYDELCFDERQLCESPISFADNYESRMNNSPIFFLPAFDQFGNPIGLYPDEPVYPPQFPYPQFFQYQPHLMVPMPMPTPMNYQQRDSPLTVSTDDETVTTQDLQSLIEEMSQSDEYVINFIRSFDINSASQTEVFFIKTFILSVGLHVPFMKKMFVSVYANYAERWSYLLYDNNDDLIYQIAPIIKKFSAIWLSVLNNFTTEVQRNKFLVNVSKPLAVTFSEAGGNPNDIVTENRAFRLVKHSDNENASKSWLGIFHKTELNKIRYNSEWDTYAKLIDVCKPFVGELARLCVRKEKFDSACN